MEGTKNGSKEIYSEAVVIIQSGGDRLKQMDEIVRIWGLIGYMGWRKGRPQR